MEKKISSKIKCAVYFQIFLMVGMTFAFSYFMSEYNRSGILFVEQKKNEMPFLLNILKKFNNIFWDENNLVSAAGLNEIEDYFYGYNGTTTTNAEITALDISSGVYTCPKDNKGRYCQEYPASSCSANCNVSCIPTPASQSAVCKVGTCYDSKEGSCAIGATRQTCENSNGLWYDDPLGNINVCKAGCCVLGENALFITEKQCEKESVASGITKLFKPEIKTEISCLALSKTQEEGACVLEDTLGNSCRFTTKTNCALNLKGKFYSGYLCSHPDFNTKCIKQATTSCVEGKDEIYFFDSCGNRENIYSVNKEQSYNNGRVLAKSDSCNLDIKNKNSQATCGNCNYFAGSTCGTKTASEKLAESSGEFVCRDLRCTDENGKAREHGESWCAYQGAIGLDKGVLTDRATNPVGSRSFKSTCYEGEIITDPCADYNNEICTQSIVKTDAGKDFSTAACRTNRAYECYQYNKPESKNQCTKNPDCSIKEVAISENFKFDLCTPKYTPGFDLVERGEGAATMCAFASQKCQVVKVKKLSGWKCVANCDCANTQKFAEQMNDMCISLGDCGTKANYLGDISVNHGLYKGGSSEGLGTPIGGEYAGLSNNYINKLTSYANEKTIKNNYIEAASLEEFYGQLGIPGSIGSPLNSGEDKSQEVLGQVQTISGAMGIVALLANTQTGINIITSVYSTVAGVGAKQAALSTVSTTSAFAGALTGAAIGFAMVSFLLDYTGVGRGLPPALVYHLTAMGASAGAIIGANFLATGGAFGSTGTLAGGFGGGISGIGTGLAAAAAVAWIVIVVVIVIIVVFAALGIGKVKKEYYSFQCLPWEAPTGGAKCSECGSDGKTCSKYSCQSLGQTCQLINEETEKPECVDISPNDVSAPLINLNESYFPTTYKVEKTGNGAKIITDAEDGCVSESFSMLLAGIDVNEPSRCEVKTDNSQGEDGGEILSNGLYRSLHALQINVPPLSSLGLEDFDPSSRGEITYYVSCQDKSGNKNVNAYGINFCVSPGNDITPPVIINKDPFLETVKTSASVINASVFTSEPADCKWSSTDRGYELMENTFTCANDFDQREGIFGWRCSSTFGMDTNEKQYYVRCMDQPWISADDPTNITGRNTNVESYVLKFKRATRPLSIDSINVDNKTFEFQTSPASVEIIVKTSGGLDGTAKCGYVWGTQTIDFYETLGLTHRQVSPAYLPGEYSLTIKCVDQIGETAERTANFLVKMDSEAPQITRAYSSYGILNIITDEKSNCYYVESAEQDCYFDINDKNLTQVMTGSNTLLHTLNLDYGSTYSIKCTDEFGHYPGECTGVIRGVNL